MTRVAMARRTLGSLRPYRAKVVAAGVCTVVQAVVGLLPVLIVKALIDHLQQQHRSFGHVGTLVAAGAALVLVGGVFGVLRTWLVLSVQTGVVADLRQQLADRLLGQSLSYYTRSRGGE